MPTDVFCILYAESGVPEYLEARRLFLSMMVYCLPLQQRQNGAVGPSTSIASECF